MSPEAAIVMEVDAAAKCMNVVDEAIGTVERQLGY